MFGSMGEGRWCGECGGGGRYRVYMNASILDGS